MNGLLACLVALSVASLSLAALDRSYVPSKSAVFYKEIYSTFSPNVTISSVYNSHDFTVSLWFKIEFTNTTSAEVDDSTERRQTLLETYSDAGTSFRLESVYQSNTQIIVTINGVQLGSYISLQNYYNYWYHLVATFEGSTSSPDTGDFTLSVYSPGNGTSGSATDQTMTASVSRPIFNANTKLRVGVATTNQDETKVVMTEGAVWTVALSSDDVTAIRNSNAAAASVPAAAIVYAEQTYQLRVFLPTSDSIIVKALMMTTTDLPAAFGGTNGGYVDGCFPGASEVYEEKRGKIRIDQVLPGDRLAVQVAGGNGEMKVEYSAVYHSLHHQSTGAAILYRTFKVEGGSEVTSSEGHMVVRQAPNGVVSTVSGKEVKVGDKLYRFDAALNSGKWLLIESIDLDVKFDAYNPMTLTGTIIVNNFAASVWPTASAMQMDLLCAWPLRMAYHMDLYRPTSWSSVINMDSGVDYWSSALVRLSTMYTPTIAQDLFDLPLIDQNGRFKSRSLATATCSV